MISISTRLRLVAAVAAAGIVVIGLATAQQSRETVDLELPPLSKDLRFHAAGFTKLSKGMSLEEVKEIVKRSPDFYRKGESELEHHYVYPGYEEGTYRFVHLEFAFDERTKDFALRKGTYEVPKSTSPTSD